MTTAQYQANGVNGQLELFHDKVIIRRKRAMAVFTQGLKGDKEILISSITSIQFKKASFWTKEFIHFGFMGGKEAKGGLFQATQDENSVMFTPKQQPDFENIKAEIEKRTGGINISKSSYSQADEIAKLAELRERGILSEEEFQNKKRKILES
jgi:hypothetical protein